MKMTDLVADHEVQFLQAQLFDFLLVRNRKIHIFLLDTDFKFPTPTSRLRSEKVGMVGNGRERSGKVDVSSGGGLIYHYSASGPIYVDSVKQRGRRFT